MVVGEATRTRTRKDKAPTVNTFMPPEVQGTSESSRANPLLASSPLPKREAYVMVDALKNFMSIMTDTITRQVSEQVKRLWRRRTWPGRFLISICTYQRR